MQRLPLMNELTGKEEIEEALVEKVELLTHVDDQMLRSKQVGCSWISVKHACRSIEPLPVAHPSSQLGQRRRCRPSQYPVLSDRSFLFCQQAQKKVVAADERQIIAGGLEKQCQI